MSGHRQNLPAGIYPEQLIFRSLPMQKELLLASPVIFLKIPQHQRVKHLVEIYACLNRDDLAESIRKLVKRLGYDQTRFALEALDEGDFHRIAEIMLYFYDKYYLKGSQKRDPSKVVEVALKSVNHEENAAQLLQMSL